MCTHTNKEAIKARTNKHIANQIDFRVQELCKMAESIGFRLLIDYKPQKATFDVVVRHDPKQEQELQLFD